MLILCAFTLLLASSLALMTAYGYAWGSYGWGSYGWGYYGSGYYYGITTNWEGVDVPMGATVIATAKTNNSQVDHIQFIWIDPNGHTVKTETKTVTFDGTHYKAESNYVPTILGLWTVKAKFLDQNGFLHCCCDETVETKKTTFFVVPEIPLIGTAGASIAMFAGLAIKMKRKPKN
jgi:hypothetical protein